MSLSSLKRLFTGEPDSLNGPDSLLIDGRTVAVRYRGNAQARRIIMRMDKHGHGIVLTVPTGTSAQAAHQFAQGQAGWIWQRLAPESQAPATLDGCSITIRDTEHVIEATTGRGAPVHIRDLPSPRLMVRGDAEHMQRRITDFLKREARRDLEKASRGYAEAMQVEFMRLSVRDTTSRWGSCSSTGTLSYSWRSDHGPAEGPGLCVRPRSCPYRADEPRSRVLETGLPALPPHRLCEKLAETPWADPAQTAGLILLHAARTRAFIRSANADHRVCRSSSRRRWFLVFSIWRRCTRPTSGSGSSSGAGVRKILRRLSTNPPRLYALSSSA